MANAFGVSFQQVQKIRGGANRDQRPAACTCLTKRGGRGRSPTSPRGRAANCCRNGHADPRQPEGEERMSQAARRWKTHPGLLPIIRSERSGGASSTSVRAPAGWTAIVTSRETYGEEAMAQA